jgi:hypothetical protein
MLHRTGFLKFCPAPFSNRLSRRQLSTAWRHCTGLSLAAPSGIGQDRATPGLHVIDDGGMRELVGVGRLDDQGPETCGQA